MPEAIASRARVAPPAEPGQPLAIEGTVTDREGRPAPGVIVYAYHTDASGIYPRAATRHGRLRGWARTDEAGRYRFDTIRPGAYPGRSAPQHVHMHVIEPGVGTYWIADIVFTDDPLLSAGQRRPTGRERGGSGVATPASDGAGGWQVRRDIRLGAAGGPTTRFTAPEVRQTQTIHVVLRLQDDGRPPLCAYRRAVVTVRP